MKKFLALLLLFSLVLCMTACSRGKKDLSELETFSSGELRALIKDAKEVADRRLIDMGLDLSEEFFKNMEESGYSTEITDTDDNCIWFVLEDDSSLEFMMINNDRLWTLSVKGNSTPKFLRDCLASMAKALADIEGHPEAESFARYVTKFNDELPIENLSPDQSCQCYYNGYVYTVRRAPDSYAYVLYIE